MVGTIVRLIAKRLLLAVPILLVVSALLFIVLRLLPVDPAAMSLPPNATIAEVEAMRTQMGLNLPIYQQYAIWLGETLSGNLGDSIRFRSDVLGLVGQTLPATIELAALSMLIATVIGLAGGLLLFHLRGTVLEPALDLLSIALLSLPEFLWALFLLLLFGVALQALPFMGRLSPEFQPPGITGFLLLDALLARNPALFWDALTHMILPSLAIGIAQAPAIMRVLRSSLLDTYQDDFVHQARLRGLSEGQLLVGHALKNAILPTLGLMGVQFGFLFGGTLLVEVIYSFPGMGNLMVDAIRNADLPVIQAVGLTYCIAVLLISIAVDALYMILNPKLRTQ